MSRSATARKMPAAPRRISGPVRHGPLRPSLRPLPASSPARTTTVALPAPSRGIGVLDRLLRSRAWIWLIGLMLGGIVAMQVSLLKLNAGISRAVESAATLERQNAELEAEVAHLSSGERIREAAAKLGMVAPDASAVAWLTVRGSGDAQRAARRMVPPSTEARALLANRGIVAPGTVLSGVTQAPTTIVEEPAAQPTTAQAQPQATPAQTATPQPSATAQPAAANATGGAAAGQG